MRIGVIFPQLELGGDPRAVDAYGRTVEKLGFDHLVAYDHVLGADPAVHAGWDGVYDVNTTFHEPLVMFGYLAAITTRIELVTGVLVLPQRQTALVAKQAAEVDLLSKGRLRLGVGVGWNRVEYEALDQQFDNRGKRANEQIALLRKLWTTSSVTFAGRYHSVTGAGLAPMPNQRPIPIWVGAASPAGYRRAGRLADGWFPPFQPGGDLDKAKAIIVEAAIEAGRDPSEIGLQGSVSWRGDVDAVVEAVRAWKQNGATHVAINTMGQALSSVDEHLAVLTDLAVALNLSSGL